MAAVQQHFDPKVLDALKPKSRFEPPNRVWSTINGKWSTVRGEQQAKLVAALFEANGGKVRTAILQSRLGSDAHRAEIRIDKIIGRLKKSLPAVGNLIKNDRDQDGYYIEGLHKE